MPGPWANRPPGDDAREQEARAPEPVAGSAAGSAGAEGNSRREAEVADVAGERERSSPAELEAEIARLQGLLADKERAVSVRTRLADEEIERAKQRIEKEARKEQERRTRSFLLSFLDVVDDLDRAIAAARDKGDESAVLSGVELVRKGFLDKLARHDVAHQPALGERFDPERHEAVGMVPVDSADRDGVVVGVIREGYRMGADTLRPASVAVGRYTGLH